MFEMISIFILFLISLQIIIYIISFTQIYSFLFLHIWYILFKAWSHYYLFFELSFELAFTFIRFVKIIREMFFHCYQSFFQRCFHFHFRFHPLKLCTNLCLVTDFHYFYHFLYNYLLILIMFQLWINSLCHPIFTFLEPQQFYRSIPFS